MPRTVHFSAGKPVNFMAGIPGKSFTVAELEAAGVGRISVATSLYRAAISGLASAAKEILEKDSIEYVRWSLSTPDVAALMKA